MPPKTRSSVSNDSNTSNRSASTIDDPVEHVSPPDSIDDSTVLATVLDSIKAAQVTWLAPTYLFLRPFI
jgi:hypothetical protein